MLAHLRGDNDEAQQAPMVESHRGVNNLFNRDRLETPRDSLEGDSQRKQLSLDRNSGANRIDKMRRSSRISTKHRANCKAYTNQAWLQIGQLYSSVEKNQLPHLRLLKRNLNILHQKISLRYGTREREAEHNTETHKLTEAAN